MKWPTNRHLLEQKKNTIDTIYKNTYLKFA